MTSKKNKAVSVALVGASGMGLYYLKTLLEEFSPESLNLRAVVDPFPVRSEEYTKLKDLGIPIFPSLGDFYDSGRSAELVIISSPIHYHVPQSCEALIHGSHVLCEKPLGATIQEARHLIHTRDTEHRWVMIGYQWSYSAAIQELKKDIQKGRFGKPVRLKTLCFWPRGEDYYTKSNWIGRTRDQEGYWILDSPANNAMAHFLHNLLYILGDGTAASARPAEVTAELFRAYPIENYDSVACRVFTEEGAELLFYASHTVDQERGPLFSLEFEQAEVTFGEAQDNIFSRDRRGREKHYGSPEAEHPFRKLFEAVESVREPRPILCGPEAACSQTLCINGIQESAEVITFPESMIQREKEEGRLWVRGLGGALYECYKRGILPSEGDFSWARRGKQVDLRNYRFFPGGKPQDNPGERSP